MTSSQDPLRAAFDRVEEASLKLLDLDRRPVPRDQHPKHHGCVRAKFVVEKSLDENLRKGLFAHEAAYNAWVRVSNGAQRDDRKRDVHGMALKLMGVHGPKALQDEPDGLTQDFVMVDHPTFFLRGVKDYAAFSGALLKARGKEDSWVRNILGNVLTRRKCELATLGILYFFPWRIPTFVRLLQFASSTIDDPLKTRYYSTTAYKFTDTFMKFSVVPAALPEEEEAQGPEGDSYDELSNFLARAEPLKPETKPLAGTSPDYLRTVMGNRLKASGAAYLFLVQLFKSNSKTPIDDPTVDWLESDSPSRIVGRIWIPRDPNGEFLSEQREAFCENLSFTPWHALAAQEPVGQINEVRRRVYETLSKARHQANGIPRKEPQPSDPIPERQPPMWGDDPSAFPTVLEEELKLIGYRRDRVEDRFANALEEIPEGGSGTEVSPPSGSSSNLGNCGESRGDPALEPGDEDIRTKKLRLAALRGHVTGLAFSGGGIRSGTFAVGFLQGLAALGLIRRFDYLSTVSGGGYAGAWLAAWLRREGGDPANVEKMLAPSRVAQSKARRLFLEKGEVVDEEPEPLRHLRSYSSYLTPNSGSLTTDTWTVILIWIRNVSINLLMLLPAAMLLFVAVRLCVFLYRLLNPLAIETPRWYLVFSLLLLASGMLAAWISYRGNSKTLRLIRSRNRPDPALRSLGNSEEVVDYVGKAILNPLTAAAFLLTLSIRTAIWATGDAIESWRPATASVGSISFGSMLLDAVQSHLGLLQWPTFLFVGLLIGGLAAWGGLSNARRVGPGHRSRFVVASFIAGASGGVLLVLLAGLIRWFARIGRPDLMATFATPLGLLVVVVALIVLVALLGRMIGEAEREWWSRLSAMVTLRALTWIGLMATILYVPGLFLASGPYVRTAIASGWLGTAVFSVITGRYVLPKVGATRAKQLTTLAGVASVAFLVGMMGAVALVASVLANMPSLLSPSADEISPFAYYIQGVNGTSVVSLLIIGAGSTVLYILARGLIDVNLFSLNAMYANRLTRCYLGASRAMTTWPDRWRLPRDLRADAGAPSLSNEASPVREPNPLTGLDAKDDIDLRDLKIGRPNGADREYLGPHLLINTSLNLVGEGSLVHRDRKAESFLLSPLYCGSKSVGYARLGDTNPAGNVEPNLTLGRAISISGAAVDPNMSFYQSGSLTALLTIFNARLGYWIEKPKPIGWTAASPEFGKLLLSEFFGHTDNRGDFIHISDGGHFENMGVYELIRRRCRYIVALDAGEDFDPSNDTLANLIRLCRIDFGVRLKIDTKALAMEGPDRLTKTHVVVGDIHYEDVDHGEMPGVFVYVKISMTGDEPPDLQKYARKDTRFPHQPTDLRQSFDEEQFECYRSLGDHIGREVFADSVDHVGEYSVDIDSSVDEMPHEEFVPRLFAALKERWSEAPEGLSELYSESNRLWSDIQHDLSTIDRLQGFSQDLYPEIAQSGHESSAQDRAEFHTVGRLLAIMENSWIALSLKRYSSLPVNRGWMNSFRRWVATDAFRRAWPVLRSEFSSEFVRFCEEQLHLTAARPSLIRLPANSELGQDRFATAAIGLLDQEFAREWPDEHRRGGGPEDLIEKAYQLSDPPLASLIVQAPSGESGEQAASSPAKFACGLILAADPLGPAELDKGRGSEPIRFFVWVRRPYRSAGLGTHGLRLFLPHCLEVLKARSGETPTLRACYPRAESRTQDDLEYANFVRFLAKFDFRPIESSVGLDPNRSILELRPTHR